MTAEDKWDATINRAVDQAERALLDNALYKVLDDAFYWKRIDADDILKNVAIHLGNMLAGEGMPTTPVVQAVLDRIDRDKDDMMWS